MPDSSGPLYGLASGLTWGSGDFAGGLATKHSPVQGVVVASQTVGILLLALIALATGERLPGPEGWLLGVFAGFASALGIGCLYAALATGRMGIAASLTAVLAATIPVLYGSLREGTPATHRLAGFALALLGVWLLSRPAADTGGRTPTRTLGLALLSGTGFGVFLILLGEAGTHGVYWPLTGARATSIATMVVAALVARAKPWPATRTALWLALLAGVLDVSGNVLYILATQVGRLDVAAVLSSLYPAATVILAFVVLKERLTRAQLTGIAVVLCSIPLIVL